jgi:hypothetical protein
MYGRGVAIVAAVLAIGPVNGTDAPKTMSFAAIEPDGVVMAAANSKGTDRLGVFQREVHLFPRAFGC